MLYAEAFRRDRAPGMVHSVLSRVAAFGSAAASLGILTTTGAAAQADVDLELVLAVDASRSVDETEADVQRQGYSDAFLSAEVLGAIRSGPFGRIAVTYFEWSSPGRNAVIVPWMIIDGPESAGAFAALVGEAPPTIAQATSISGALLYAASLFDGALLASERRVIDISGDGPNNLGIPVLTAREMALQRATAINGLPLKINVDRLFEVSGIPLETYYEQCVIGGHGAFVVTVDGLADLGNAIRTKLVLEIAARTGPALRPVFVQAHPPVDCTVAE